jgi:hypothetical protein
MHSFLSLTSISLKPIFSTRNIEKATLLDGLGIAYGNKALVLPQTLLIPIDLAEEVSRFCPSKTLYHYP